MFEHSRSPLIPFHSFFSRLLRNFFWGLLIIAVSLLMGMVGYHIFEQMAWIDAFVNAAMILSGMGPLTPLTTPEGKIFAGIYALFSGIMFLLIVGIIFAPVVHRFFHKFHLSLDKDFQNSKSNSHSNRKS